MMQGVRPKYAPNLKFISQTTLHFINTVSLAGVTVSAPAPAQWVITGGSGGNQSITGTREIFNELTAGEKTWKRTTTMSVVRPDGQ